MSIDDLGLNSKISGRDMVITVKNNHPLMQLARIRGNFLFAGKCDISNQSDKHSIKMMLDTHSNTFENKMINSATTDKGYYSEKNEMIMAEHGINEISFNDLLISSKKNYTKCRKNEKMN